MNELSDIARAPSRVGTGWGFAIMLLGMLAIMAPFVSGVAVTAMVAVFSAPVTGMLTLTGILLVYFFVDGIFSIIAGVRGKGAPGWGWVTVSGIASVVLAVIIWRQWPISGAFAIGLLVGIRLIFTGWSIAMLGMLGDATIDVVEDAVEQADSTS